MAVGVIDYREAVNGGKREKLRLGIANGHHPPALQQFRDAFLVAAINRLPVVDYTDRRPAFESVAGAPRVFTID